MPYWKVAWLRSAPVGPITSGLFCLPGAVLIGRACAWRTETNVCLNIASFHRADLVLSWGVGTSRLKDRLCPCATNALVKASQGRRIAQAALKS